MIAVKQLEGSYVNPLATQILEKATAQNDSEVSETSNETSDKDNKKSSDKPTAGRENVTGLTPSEIAHFLIDVCNIAWPGDKNPTEYEEPNSFQEAWNHHDKKQRVKWREAIRKEFHDMIYKQQVWRKIKKWDIPPDRRCVKSKWVFKIKRNEVFCARLVACGYSQIPGVDYTENYSPVVNDVTFCLLLIAKMIYRLKTKTVDIETAFLYGDLKE